MQIYKDTLLPALQQCPYVGTSASYDLDRGYIYFEIDYAEFAEGHVEGCELTDPDQLQPVYDWLDETCAAHGASVRTGECVDGHECITIDGIGITDDSAERDDTATYAVAAACIDLLLPIDEVEPGKTYKVSKLIEWAHEMAQRCDKDEVSDGVQSVFALDIGGYVCIWSSITTEVDLSILPAGFTIEDWLRSWDDGEYLRSFGFSSEEEEEEVDDDYEGECSIKVIPHYLDGTFNAPSPYMLMDDDHEVMVFDSAADARAYIDEELEDGVYVLDHGEYARPDYQIVAA
jgi:hypothetical protein